MPIGTTTSYLDGVDDRSVVESSVGNGRKRAVPADGRLGAAGTIIDRRGKSL